MRKSKTLLPLLAITAFILSFSVVNYMPYLSQGNTAQVLSENDEVEEVREMKTRVETKREEEKKRFEVKVREVERKIELENEDESTPSSLNTSRKEDKRMFELESEGVTATTRFPLKLNTTTNELTITKDGEVKKVVVLPDKAVENLSRNKKIELVGEVELEENGETGKLEYKAKAFEMKKLLGLFEIKLNKEYKVSSDDGAVEEVKLTGLRRLLDLLSF